MNAVSNTDFYIAENVFSLEKTFKFSKKRIESVLPDLFEFGGEQVELSDTECRGLRLICYSSGRCVYYARFRWKGRRYSKRIGDFQSLRLDVARHDAQQFKLSVQNGSEFILDSEKKITFESFLNEAYLPHSKRTKKSYKTDQSKVVNHLIPYFKGRKMIDIDEAEVTRYLVWLRNKKSLAESTCDRHIALLQAVFRYAVEKKLLAASPIKTIKMSRPKNGRLRYLSAAEIMRFIESCHAEFNQEAAQAFLFLLATGLRISEVLHLRYEDWDQQAGHIYLRDSKTGSRNVPLNAFASQILASQSERHNKSGCIFQSQHSDKPMSRPHKVWKRIISHAKLGHEVTPHTLRHTFCAHLLMNGVDVFTVSKLLGHSSTYCVQQYYGHLSNHALVNASNVASDIFTKKSTI